MSSPVHQWRSHTAEVELAIEAETPEQVFVEAATALAELIALDRTGDEQARAITLDASDRGALLVEWLEELICLADTDSFVPERVDDLRLDDTMLVATLVGRRGRVEPLVKAATYHGLEFARRDGAWHARVVLDV
jgi:SHS2 domain-containing protein